MYRISILILILSSSPIAIAAPALSELTGKAAIDAAWTVFDPADIDTTIRFHKETYEEPKDRPPRVTMDEQGTVTLRNCGMLISKKPRGPVTISFRMKFAEREGDLKKFSDQVVVAFRLPSQPSVKTNYKIFEGLVVSLLLYEEGKVVIDKRGPMDGIRELYDEPIQFKRGIEYSVRIVDEGEKIRVLLDGKEVASAKVSAGAGLIAIYSRPSWGGPAVATLKDLRVDAKK